MEGKIMKILTIIIVLFTIFSNKNIFIQTTQQQEKKETQQEKFQYIFERRGRRNPYIEESLIKPKLPPSPPIQPSSQQTTTKKEEETKPVQIEKPSPPLRKWPPDPETAKLLKDFYNNLSNIAELLFKRTMNDLENLDELDEDEFDNFFTNIYLLYKAYYNSKRGTNLKKYSKTLKSYLQQIEEKLNPLKLLEYYLEESLVELNNKYPQAIQKPSLFVELNDDLQSIQKLLNSPILSIRKKIYINEINRIKNELKKGYEKLKKDVDTYLNLYKDFKNSGIKINGYLFNPSNPDENYIFVGNEMKKKEDKLWGDVEIVEIYDGKAEVLYKGKNLILNFWEEE
jgi:hypothetical protein